MIKTDEILTIEYTIKHIFNKDVISSEDVAIAKNLLEKYIILINQ